MSKEPIFMDIYCDPSCPFLKEYGHPYYSASAWCFKLMKELSYYDYYIADCQEDKNNDHVKIFTNKELTKAGL